MKIRQVPMNDPVSLYATVCAVAIQYVVRSMIGYLSKS